MFSVLIPKVRGYVVWMECAQMFKASDGADSELMRECEAFTSNIEFSKLNR